MTTTADGYLTVEGDRLSVGVPREAGLPVGFLLVFVVAPAMAVLSALVLLGTAPSTAAGALLWLAVSGLLVLGPGVVGVIQMLLCARGGRRREVRIDLGERLIERAGQAPRTLRQPERIRVVSRGLGWGLCMDDTLLIRAPYLGGHSLAAAATRLAEAMECELSVPMAARRARVPLPQNPRALAALAYLPFDPVAVPLSLWILATSTHKKARFAAAQSLLLEVVEVTVTIGLLSLLAIPLLALGSLVPTALSLALLLCPAFTVALLRTALRGVLSLRAGRGEASVLFGFGWLLGQRSERTTRATAQSAPARSRKRGPVAPTPRRPPPRGGAGGLGPWWT